MSEQSVPALEEWRVVAGFPDYAISETGSIKRRTGKAGARLGKPVLPRARPSSSGQLSVTLSRNGKRTETLLARLVIMTFVGAPQSKDSIICHLDGNKQNYTACNLAWYEPPNQNLDELEWRTIDICPNYEVSEFGHVRRLIPNSRGRFEGRIFATHPDSTGGYHMVSLRTAGGRIIKKSVQNLVTRAFYGPPPQEGMMAAHWDGSRENNHYTNLRWATALENSHDRYRHGTMPIGEKSTTVKLTEAQVLLIRKAMSKPKRTRHTTTQLAKEFGVTMAAIYSIAHNRCWTHLLPESEG